MEIFFSKFLPTLVYPLGLVTFLLFAAVLSRKKPGQSRTLALIALLILFLGGNRWVSSALARSLEVQYQAPAQIPAADVIVVLGGGTESASPPRAYTEVNGAGDRVIYAFRLYQQGKASHLLLSGGRISWLDEETSSPAEDMAELLTLFGVPEDALWLEDQSQNTEENAAYARAFLAEKGINRIILVTSAMHMPRSVRLFQAQGFEVIPAPADFAVTDDRWQALLHPDWRTFLVDLLPSASSLNLTTNALKEYIGMAVNRFK